MYITTTNRLAKLASHQEHVTASFSAIIKTVNIYIPVVEL